MDNKENLILVGFNNAAHLITEGKIVDYLGIELTQLFGRNSEFSKDIRKCYNEKTSFSKEIDYDYISTGKKKILYVTYTFLPPKFVIVYTEDLTNQKKAEILLKKSEEVKSIILENISEHIVYQDLEGNIIWTNKAAGDSVGSTHSQLIGKRCYRVWQNRDNRCDDCPVEDAIKTGKETKAELCTPDGRIWQIKGYPVKDKNDKVIAAVEITSEITKIIKTEEKLKQSEENYRLISENINDLISVFDTKFRFEYMNEKIHKKIMGYNKEDLIGTNGIDLVHPEDREKVLKKLTKCIKKGKGFAVARIRTKTGQFLWTETNATTFHDSNNKLKILLLTRDITRRKKAQKIIEYSEKKYREAFNRTNFYKDLFAHDINNIFQNIQSSVDLLEFNLIEGKIGEIKEYADIINDQIKRGSKLVSNVRKLSDIETLDIPFKEIDIIKILKETITYIKKSFPEKKIKIKLESTYNILIIQGSVILSDVFENILINSIRYNQNKIIEIVIKISKEKINEHKLIRLEFMDNGVGIPDEMKAKIFQRGYNQDKFIKGLGLGLTLVKKIIEMYKGKIWVEDNVKGDYSKGSNFIILLPEVD
jgi:PAS domain S-box-containing protein